MRITVELDDQMLPTARAESTTGDVSANVGSDAEIDGGGPAPHLLDEVGSTQQGPLESDQVVEDSGPPPDWLLEAIRVAESSAVHESDEGLQGDDVADAEDGGGAPVSDNDQ